MKNNKNSGLGGFLQGKGFYIALAICLAGAVGAAWITVDRTVESSEEGKNISYPENRVVAENKYDPNESLFAAQDVGKPKEDVKVEEEKPEEETFNFVPKGTEFVKPIEGKIIGKHSEGELVKYEALGEWRTHDGIDIAAAVGTEVVAAADGKITAINNDPVWGTVIEIEHKGNFTTIYSGLNTDTAFKPGDEVKSGEVIGTLGETNLAEVDKEAHLHFAMKEKGKFIDPSTKIK